MIWIAEDVIGAEMKTSAVIFLWFLVQRVSAQTCPSTITQLPIKDTEVGVQIYNTTLPTGTTFTSFDVSTTANGVSTEQTKTFFSFDVTDDLLTIATTSEFETINTLADTSGATAAFLLFVSLSCSSEGWPVSIQVTNTFSKGPEFALNQYVYSVPMPLMSRTDFTVYGEEITVSDINFANTAMTFNMTPADFDVTTSKIDNKNFKASFSANKIINLSDNTTYTLTATDSGGKTQSVLITLAIDTEEGLDSPKFSSSYYTFTYDGNAITTEDTITINTDKPSTSLYMLEGDYASYFTVTFSNDTSVFLLTLNTDNPLPTDITGQLVVTIKFTSDASAYSVLLINVLNIEVLPVFTSDYFSGTYDVDTDTITWSSKLSVDNAATVTLSSSLFKIDAESYEITTTAGLQQSDFQNSNIIFTALATSSSNNQSKATVVVSLPPSEPSVELKFDSAYYTATYANGEVTEASKITLLGVENLNNVTVTVDEAYKDNFVITHSSSEWTLSVLDHLNQTTLDSNTQLAIPLTASLNGSTASAVLIVTLPAKVSLQFNNTHYKASYLKGDKDEVSLENAIAVNGAAAGDVTIEVGEAYSSYFYISLVTGVWKVFVNNSLGSDILNGESPVLIPITATSAGSDSAAVIVLALPSKIELKFDEVYYSGTYNEGSVSLSQSITVTGAGASDISISVGEAFSDNFAVTLDSSEWKIIVRTPLNNTVLNGASPLVVPITAKASGSSGSADAVLIIDLPSSSVDLKFDRSYYTASYHRGSPNDSIDLAQYIYMSGADLEDIEVAVDDAYKSNFMVELDDTKFTIRITGNINSTVLEGDSPLLIPITATANGQSAQAVIVLALEQIIVAFKSSYYSASYVKSTPDYVQLTSDVVVDGVSNNDITMKLEQHYNAYFSIKLIEDKWTVTIGDPLPATITERTLITNITAVRKTDGRALANATLVITLPIDSEDSPRFSKTTYTGYYNKSDSTVALDTPIGWAVDNTVEATVSIEASDYSSYFALVDNNSEYGVKVEKALEDEVLESVSSLVFSLKASAESATGFATLVIVLPKTVREESVQVQNQEVLFTGTYENGVLIATDINIVTDSTSDEDISVNITNDMGINESYFSVKYSNKVLSIGVSKPFDDVINSSVAVLPLKLAITDRTTGDTVYAVLNVQVTANGSNNDDTNTETDGQRKVLLATTIALAVILVLLLAAVFFYWFWKLRRGSTVANIDTNETNNGKMFAKKEPKKPLPVTSINPRRPTGLAFMSSLPEETPDSAGSPSSDYGKKVAFNESVQRINHDAAADEDSEPEELRSVADRRPTKFVFKPQIEDFDDLDERRESTDYNIKDDVDKERKKSVVFDDNVERMHIEADDDDEDDDDKTEETDE